MPLTCRPETDDSNPKKEDNKIYANYRECKLD